MTQKIKLFKNVVFVILVVALFQSGQLYITIDNKFLCIAIYTLAIICIDVHCLLNDKLRELNSSKA